MKAFKLKFTLDDSDPKITRTVAVPEHASFADLHSIIQSVMGWEDYHLHNFKVGTEYIGPDDGEFPCTDEDYAAISDYHGKKIRYNYDFGDNWWVTVTWLKDIDDYGSCWPTLLDWKENSPPEDCGGVHGYYRMLRILADPGHEEYDHMMEWAGDLEFDEDDVENSLQSWPVQGVRTEGSEILPHMARMVIMMSMMAFTPEPLVFDCEELMPLIVKNTKQRKSKRRDGRSEELPSVSPEKVEMDPERYIPLAEPGPVRFKEVADRFAETYPEMDLPDVKPGREFEYLSAVEKNGLEDEFTEHILMYGNTAPIEWARENGFYFKDEMASPMSAAERFAQFLHDRDADITDEEELQRLVQEFNSTLR